MNVGFVVNAEIRDNGTFSLIRDALWRRMDYKGKQRWDTRGAGYTEDCDFYIFVDDGRDDIPMDVPRPNAAWMIDTHLGWDVRREWAEHFDFVFCAQRGGAERMARDGLNAHWLPLAAHPPAHPNFGEIMTSGVRDEILQGRSLDKQHDLVFVGFMNEDSTGNNRVEYLDAIFRALPNSWLAVNCFADHMAAHYIRGRLGFNLSIRDDLNMRFFEIPSTGTAMLTNRNVVGWEELGFEENVHFIGYQGGPEAVEKATYYLRHHDEREIIAANAHRFVRENHTYVHRIREMFRICELEAPNAIRTESESNDSIDSEEGQRASEEPERPDLKAAGNHDTGGS